jgi:ABC-type nitrate/sulfonate/bicarbonate transport system substrate-binding protein
MADRIVLGMVSRTFYYVPVWAALEHGFFAAQGLDVAVEILGNTVPGDGLRSGALQVAIAPPEGILQDVAAGGSLRFVAGNSGKLSHCLITRPQFRTVEDLKGARIGILSMTEGSLFHFQAIAERHGLSYPDDYEIVLTGGAPPRHKALLDGTIDAGLQSIPWTYFAEDAGFNNLLDVGDYVPDWQFNAYSADLRWAEPNRDRLVRFLRAMRAATEWVYGHRAGAAEIVERELGISRTYGERGWDYFTGTGALTRDLAINLPGVARVVEAQEKAGMIPKGRLGDGAAAVDSSFLAEANNG